MHRSRTRRLLSVLAIGMLVLGGCTLGGSRAGDGGPLSRTRDPGTASASAGSESASPSGRAGDRPIQPVPEVEPPGFADPPPGSGIQRYLTQKVTWTSCNQGRECTTILVPLDWSRPDGQAITLALARIKAIQGPSLGTLFVNPGGPGGSGVDLINWLDVTGLRDYDIVGWDPRGAGRSTPVRCENGAALDAYFRVDVSPDTHAEDTALQQANRAFGASCLARSGALLEHISTLDTVKDMDLMRALLGDDKLNLLGFSYGTLLGAVYAQEFPDHVGRMVLDGAVDITGDPTITQAGGFERMIDAFARWCSANTACTLGSTKSAVLDEIRDLLASLDQHPLPVGSRELSQTLGIDAVIAPLYLGQAGYLRLAAALMSARHGDGTAMLALADRFNERDSDGTYSPLMAAFSAIRCSEPDEGLAGARSDLADATEDAPVLGPFLGLDYVCPEWPVAPQPPLPTLVGAGAPPILVIGTTEDPATPYEYAVSMARQLDSGVLLTRVGTGHTAYARGNACIDETVRAFLNDGTVPPDGKRCS